MQNLMNSHVMVFVCALYCGINGLCTVVVLIIWGLWQILTSTSWYGLNLSKKLSAVVKLPNASTYSRLNRILCACLLT